MVKQEKQVLAGCFMVLIIGVAYYQINFQHLSHDKLLSNTITLIVISFISFWSMRFLQNEYSRLRFNEVPFYKILIYLLFLLGVITFFITVILSGGIMGRTGHSSAPWYNK